MVLTILYTREKSRVLYEKVIRKTGDKDSTTYFMYCIGSFTNLVK